ncbi:MAG: response regulator transcription factor [Clostridiales bacterium]|nr:response regulator transcription factor [Clostridiales bacterium]
MRILLAEDEKSLARAIVTILKKHNYEADAVYNGEDALAYLQSGNYDAAILDIMMPGMSGIDALVRVRESGVTLPILLLTAKSEVRDKVAGLDSGANDYMTKPFNPQELLARIRAMTRSPLAKEPNRLSMGNVSLDLASYELSTPAGSFRLTSKEFQMMEMLLANPRRLIPTERFLEKIWGYDTEAEIHVVWVYISYLRKKLASLQANVQIRVARNAGYSLEEIP